MYTVHTELRSGEQLVDQVTEPLGVRSFAVDASTGFSLNGKYLDLRGVNRHQDRLDMGWAITEREHDEDDGRNEGDTPGRNDKGLVSYDRKTKKDAFYWYKANWSTEPVVYITSRRYTPRPAASTTVKIYANTCSVELRVNGVSQGSITGQDHIFTWPDIVLAGGTNSIEAIGTAGTEAVTDSVTWMR